MELTFGTFLVALSQGLQFLFPMAIVYLSQKRWFYNRFIMYGFIGSMVGSIPLIQVYYPHIMFGSEPRIVILYPMFAVGFALVTENLPITVLLTCFLAEAQELPTHLLLRNNIGFIPPIFHTFIVVTWMILVFYFALRIRDVNINTSFVTIFVTAFALTMLTYFIDPMVDIPPLSFLSVTKRLIWFIALSILFRKGR